MSRTNILKSALKPSLENGDAVAELSGSSELPPVETATYPEDQLQTAEVDQPNEDSATLETIAAGLESLLKGIEACGAAGLDEQGKRFSRIALDNARRTVGMDTTGFISLESISTVSMEAEITETLKKMWQAIKEAVAKAWKALLNFIDRHINSLAGIQHALPKLEADFKKFNSDNVHPKSEEVTFAGMTRLSVEGKWVPNEILAALQELDRFQNSIQEDIRDVMVSIEKASFGSASTTDFIKKAPFQDNFRYERKHENGDLVLVTSVMPGNLRFRLHTSEDKSDMRKFYDNMRFDILDESQHFRVATGMVPMSPDIALQVIEWLGVMCRHTGTAAEACRISQKMINELFEKHEQQILSAHGALSAQDTLHCLQKASHITLSMYSRVIGYFSSLAMALFAYVKASHADYAK